MNLWEGEREDFCDADKDNSNKTQNNALKNTLTHLSSN